MSDSEDILLRVKPNVIKCHPILFSFFIISILISLVLIPYIVVVLLVGYWLLYKYKTELIVTSKRSRVKRGILSKNVIEIEHRDLRNARINQGVLHKLTGVGTLGLSSGGESGVEVKIDGIENPEQVRDLVYQNRE